MFNIIGKYHWYIKAVAILAAVSFMLIGVFDFMSNVGNLSRHNEKYLQIGSSPYSVYNNEIYYPRSELSCLNDYTCSRNKIFEKIEGVEEDGFIVLDEFLPKAVYNEEYYYEDELIDKQKINFDFLEISKTRSTEPNFYHDDNHLYCGKFPYELKLIGKKDSIEKKREDKVWIGGKIIDNTCIEVNDI